MRITSGIYKNRKLVSPDSKNFRAVQDVVKLSVFSILTSDYIVNTECLDLYAGSGSLGLEALSRGAKHCDFVDEDKYAVRAINENIKTLELQKQATVYHENALKHAANTSKTYDLIFADPFYEDTKHKFLFENLEEILNKAGRIIFLHGSNTNVPEQLANTKLKTITNRKFGKGQFTIISH